MLRRVCLLALLVAFLGEPGRARADSVPVKNQALLLLRILAYDHNLGTRVNDKTVTIVVVSKAGSSDSEDLANELVSTVRELAKNTTVSNNAIQVVRLPYAEKTFEADIGKIKAAALYIAPGLGDSVGAITTVTHL